ncbi:hypothetical protein K438DRAFT_1787444 [Mycena galopus ATCC 62051]|nr:hypothetical protein K438DRAFT_1787444 [Mycena galopus ATCC 62051]
MEAPKEKPKALRSPPPPPWTNLGLPRSTSAYPLPTLVYPSISTGRQRLVDIGLPLSTSVSVYVMWTAFAYLRLPSATSVGLPSARSARSVYLDRGPSTRETGLNTASVMVNQMVEHARQGLVQTLVYWGGEHSEDKSQGAGKQAGSGSKASGRDAKTGGKPTPRLSHEEKDKMRAEDRCFNCKDSEEKERKQKRTATTNYAEIALTMMQSHAKVANQTFGMTLCRTFLRSPEPLIRKVSPTYILQYTPSNSSLEDVLELVSAVWSRLVRIVSIPNNKPRVVVDVLLDEPRNEHFEEPFYAEMVIGPAILRNTNAEMMGL